jgi:hypothetical protein
VLNGLCLSFGVENAIVFGIEQLRCPSSNVDVAVRSARLVRLRIEAPDKAAVSCVQHQLAAGHYPALGLLEVEPAEL